MSLTTVFTYLQKKPNQSESINLTSVSFNPQTSQANPQRIPINTPIPLVNPTRIPTIFANSQRNLEDSSRSQQNQTPEPIFVDSQLPKYEDLFPNDSKNI